MLINGISMRVIIPALEIIIWERNIEDTLGLRKVLKGFRNEVPIFFFVLN
jgi:hypothetical protein